MTDWDFDARGFRTEVVTAFEAAQAAADSFALRGTRVSRVMAEWSGAAGTLRARFGELSDILGSTFAAALEPAVQALNRFMAAVLRVARTFRSFVFSLFGKTADAAETGADAWDDLGASASGAGKRVSAAAKEVRRSLMAFDQIQRLDWHPDTSSGSGGSGGGGSAIASLFDWSDFVPANAFGELLHSLLEDSRFAEAGQALAAKLGEIVDNLDAALTDEAFQAKLRRGIQSFNELLNGFLSGLTFEEKDRLSVAGRIGDFLGDAAGLALESAHEFLAGLDWGSLGTAIAQLVNGAVQSLREKEANVGTVLSDWLNARLGTLDGLFSGLDWSGAGAYVSENVNAWFANVDWTLVGATLRDGILGLGEFVTAALSGIDIDWHGVVSSLLGGLFGENIWTRVRNWFIEGWNGIVDSLGDNKIIVSLADFLGFDLDSLKLDPIEIPAKADLQSAADNLPADDRKIAVTAAMTKRTLGEKVTLPIGKLTAAMTKRTLGEKVTLPIGKLTAAMTKRTLGEKVTKDITGLTAQFRYRDFASRFPWTIYGMTAQVSDVYLTSSAKASLRASLRGEAVMAKGGVFVNGGVRPIQAYASGGAPGGGQLFVAREAGPELVGTLKGHTAVMNNDQIVASVSAGVARAIAGVKFYSRERATPQLAFIGGGVSRSEEHLARLAQNAADEADAGGTAKVIDLLAQILTALRTVDRDVYLDGESVKDRIVARINARTRATGACEILV